MSELQTRFIDDTYCEYYNTGKHDLAQIYLKSEADKVIAEKDTEIDELKERIEVLNHQVCKMNCAMVKHYNEVCDDLIHQKFKRCLAMAKWCRMHDEFTQLESERLGLPQRALFFAYRRKAMWWNKWHKRWLELAEQFKEGV